MKGTFVFVGSYRLLQKSGQPKYTAISETKLLFLLESLGETGMSYKPSVSEVINRYGSLKSNSLSYGYRNKIGDRLDTFPGEVDKSGYRSDSLSERGDLNIAYIGCSWCEGFGVHSDEIFSKQVSRILSEKTGLDVRSWNFGKSGSGIDYILRMVPIICEVQKPDFMIVVLPDGKRREYFSKVGRKVSFKEISESALQRKFATKKPYDGPNH